MRTTTHLIFITSSFSFLLILRGTLVVVFKRKIKEKREVNDFDFLMASALVSNNFARVIHPQRVFLDGESAKTVATSETDMEFHDLGLIKYANHGPYMWHMSLLEVITGAQGVFNLGKTKHIIIAEDKAIQLYVNYIKKLPKDKRGPHITAVKANEIYTGDFTSLDHLFKGTKIPLFSTTTGSPESFAKLKKIINSLSAL